MLQVKNLQVSYNESRILQDVTLEVQPGQAVCLIGRNGVGKTTFLKSVMGVLKARAGSISYDGEDITRWPSHLRARAGIGYVPQGRNIFPHLSVKENLLMGLEATKVKDRSDSQLDEMYQLFPVLRTMAKRMAGTLSGGQQQQLAIARTLISKPRLLLLDEPTEGIQPSIVAEIEEVIIALQQQGHISILLVEQFLDFALSIANRCYIMEKGSIVLQGAASDITPAAVQEYLAV
jgi:urea transport system ATP-binding protein